MADLAGYTGMCRSNHALRWYHPIIGGGGIIVKDNSNKAHQPDNIVGGTFEKDAAD
jgi:hypothetical protein